MQAGDAARPVDRESEGEQLSGMAAQPRPVLYFDYVDPGSYLLDRLLRELLPRGETALRHPLELRTPPQPLIDAQEADWRAYSSAVRALAEASGIEMIFPPFIPWSRKAHELALHGAEKGQGESVHLALLQARFLDGADIGRVDVLVGLAAGLGLDLSETKAVLDIDRYAQRVEELRNEAGLLGVRRPATLTVGPTSLEGPASIDDLRGFLEAASLLQ